ncbi:MAG: hypothetical protein Q9191_001090 [Dirinaria sp. TL-2023a]
MLTKLRNTWEFANIMQYIYIFGRAVKIDDDLTIEDLEAECLKPESSEKLLEIGLALLKCVSSHRGLSAEIFDEYTRRQYMAKAPNRNPFGDEEDPKKFAEFDVFTKLRILVQLSQWTLINPDRMRERMSETKDIDQIQWRIEEIGYDKQERLYFVLDDNRLYRRTDPGLPPPPPPKPKANSKKARAAARANKRRKLAEAEETANDADGEGATTEVEQEASEEDTFGGRKWECIAVTLTEYKDFLESIRKSRDVDEKALFKYLTEDVLPIIEKAEEDQQKKKARREKEMMNLQKLATAKRSSRLAGKQEREREEQEAAEAERKRKADLAAAKQNQERQKQMDEARQSRMITREQRLKEREYKRILHEEELTNMSEDSKKLDAGEARMSERNLKKEMDKRRKELAALEQEDEWTFDCAVCGVHGENLDDGTHSIACEKCNVWQHSACHGISQEAAEKDDFHFICHDCKRRAEDALKPKIPSLKFRLGSSSSPPSQKVEVRVPMDSKKRKSNENAKLPPMKKFKPASEAKPHITPGARTYSNGLYGGQNGMHQSMMSGPTLSPQGQPPQPPDQASNNGQATSPPPGLRSPPGPPAHANGYTHHVNYQNGYTPRPHYTFENTHPSTSSGKGQTHKSPNTAWSATYQPAQHTHTPQQATPVPPSANPFHNSFDRQRPTSSGSPVMNGPTLSPAPSAYSPATNGYHQNANTNGLPSQTYSLPPPLPPPVKHQSSPPAPAPQQLPSSSPAMGPNLQRRAPPSPGLSPTKHPSPKPAAFDSNSVDATPSPMTGLKAQQQNQYSPSSVDPMKQSSPPRPPPNSSSSPVMAPALPTQASISPGFSPTKQSSPKQLPAVGNSVEKVMPPVENLSPSPQQTSGRVQQHHRTSNGEIHGF